MDARKCGVTLMVIVLAAVGIGLWYNNLDDTHKRFVKNIARQAKYLPARYAV